MIIAGKGSRGGSKPLQTPPDFLCRDSDRGVSSLLCSIPKPLKASVPRPKDGQSQQLTDFYTMAFKDKKNCVSACEHGQSYLTLRPHGLWPTTVLCPQDILGKNTGVVAISSFRGSFQPRDQIGIPCTAGTFFTTEPSGKRQKLCTSKCKTQLCTPETPFDCLLTASLGEGQAEKHKEFKETVASK